MEERKFGAIWWEGDHKVYLNTVYGYYFYSSSYKYGDDAKLPSYIWQIKRVLKPRLGNNVFKKLNKTTTVLLIYL